MGFDEKLADIAECLVSASPSSASLERHLSTLGFTYGSLRSRLGVDKTRKLSFLYRQLNKLLFVLCNMKKTILRIKHVFFNKTNKTCLIRKKTRFDQPWFSFHISYLMPVRFGRNASDTPLFSSE